MDLQDLTSRLQPAKQRHGEEQARERRGSCGMQLRTCGERGKVGRMKGKGPGDKNFHLECPKVDRDSSERSVSSHRGEASLST